MARPLNLLFLCSARAWGGNEKWTLAAAEGLAHRGHVVHLGVRSPIFQERARGAEVAFRSYPFSGNLDLKTILALRRDLQELAIDVVIPTKQREYLLGGLAARGTPAKVVARLGIDRPIRNWRNRLAFHRLFDRVIVNSQRIVEVLAQDRKFDASICRVVHNGIPLPELDPSHRPRIRAELGFSDRDFVVAGVGRLTPQKGFDLAIEAFAQVAAEVPEAKLLLVGEGSALAEFESLVESQHLGDHVLFAGFRSDVPAVLQAVDLFWLTSRSEGMANVLLEAMAGGRASVAFDISGVRELLREGIDGRIVPFGDLDALAQTTLTLRSDTGARQGFETSARQRVAADFSPESMVAGVERVLAEIVGKP